MRLGIMLRHFDQHEGGVKVYTRELMNALVAANTRHEIVMLYRDRKRLGTYRGEHVTEVLLEGGPIVYWDHVKVPRAVRELGIDVLFNPKYSIPLSVECRTAWVCHGLDWYVMPQASRWIDRLNHRWLIPQYAARSDAVDRGVRDHARARDEVSGCARRARTYGLLGVERRVSLTAVSSAARWPRGVASICRRGFLLYCGAGYPPKNFTRLIRAYAKVGPARAMPLVIAGGSNRFLSAQELLEPQRSGHQRLGSLDRLAGQRRLARGVSPRRGPAAAVPLRVGRDAGDGGDGLWLSRAHRQSLWNARAGRGRRGARRSRFIEDIAAGIVRLLEDQPLRAKLRAAGLERARALYLAADCG